MVGANIMSDSYVFLHLGERPLVPTNRTFGDAPGSILEGIEILHDVYLLHDDIKVALDFHVFDVHDFDILIGHLIKKCSSKYPR
jgi:hypothetical protein